MYCDLTCLDRERKLDECCNPWGVGQGVSGPGGWRPRGDGGGGGGGGGGGAGLEDTEEASIGLTTEEEAEKTFKEREDWLIHEKQLLFQRQQKLHVVRLVCFCQEPCVYSDERVRLRCVSAGGLAEAAGADNVDVWAHAGLVR